MTKAVRATTTRWAVAAGQGRPARLRGDELHRAWGAFVGRVPWTDLVTLTFDPKRVFPVERALAEREALHWCGLVGWMHRCPATWLVAAERGSSGVWHSHVLLAGVSGPVVPLARIWEARNGRVDVRSVCHTVGAVMYTAKSTALTGQIVLSDTITRYRDRLLDRPRVALYAETNEEHGR